MTAFLVALTLAASTPPSQWVVVGEGLTSCGDWTRARKTEGWESIVKLGWLGGFLSGLNMVGDIRHSGNITDGHDMAGMTGWIDKFCEDSPLSQMSEAAKALTRELVSHRPSPSR